MINHMTLPDIIIIITRQRLVYLQPDDIQIEICIRPDLLALFGLRHIPERPVPLYMVVGAII